MTAEIRKEIRAHSAQWEIGILGTTYADAIFATLSVTSRLHEQFSYVATFIRHKKLIRQLFNKYIGHIKNGPSFL